MERRIILNLDYCIGCRSCESACAARFWNERRIRHSEIVPPAREAFLPSPCRHCEDALCLKACPFGVIRRDEEKGIIFRSSFECIGCSSCILACPFGVMEKNLLRHIAPKCDLCRDREEGPRCVATCPTGALQFWAEEEIPKERVGVRFVSRSPYWRRV
uniref:4Fe-4S dicluster domain-containing protein n=1 Tax=candidate division WOR-3 bacterium TaxID=2052148 RepID=A0A7C3YPI9_UNCW3